MHIVEVREILCVPNNLERHTRRTRLLSDSKVPRVPEVLYE